MSRWREGGGREAAYGVRSSLSLSVIWSSSTICQYSFPDLPGLRGLRCLSHKIGI